MTKQATAQTVAATLSAAAAPLVKELSLAVKASDKAGARIVAAVVAFRKLDADEKTVKAFITEAYVSAGYDEKSKTLANMRSAALAIIRAPSVPNVLPKSLQLAAAQVRAQDDYKAMSQAAGRKGAKAGKAPAKRAARQPIGNGKPENDKAPSADVEPLDVDAIRAELLDHVNQLKARAADDVAASLLAELVDVLS